MSSYARGTRDAAKREAIRPELITRIQVRADRNAPWNTDLDAPKALRRAVDL
jgi:hypothetical protein